MRKAFGIVIGAIVAMLTIGLIETLGHGLFPSAAGTSTPSGPPDLANTPTEALVAVVVAWFVGAATGGWSAARIARWPAAAWIIAGLVALAGVYNLTQIPTPIWMQIATIVAPALGGATAHLVSRQRG